MDSGDEYAKHLFDRARFCPICGQKLLLSSLKVGDPRVHEIEVPVKLCPQGEGSLDVGMPMGEYVILFKE